MSFEAKAVANHLLDLAEVKGESLTPMKLQKLAFFAHGWHLALAHKPLIVGGVQAWKYGPVINSLYGEFKGFGKQGITRKAVDLRTTSENGSLRLEEYEPSLGDGKESDADVKVAEAIIDRVFSLYGIYSGPQLSDMTHREGTPWHKIRQAYPEDLPKRVTIPDEIIRQYFLAQLQTTKPVA